MSDAYQTRRDIDRIIRFVNELDYILKKNNVESLGELLSRYYDASDVDVRNHKLNQDLTRLDSNLTGFETDLNTFEGNLDKFSGDLTGFEGNLDKFEGDLDDFDGRLDDFDDDLDDFKTDLTGFQTDLNTLDNNLTSLNSSLDNLSLDLYGDNTHDGFVDYLNQLQVMLYGKGQTYVLNGVTHTCSIQDPCPTSLKGLLNTLQTSNNELKQDNDKLKESLYALTIGLTSFTMTLNEFKAELTRNNISYSELDDGIATLLELIFNAQGRINTVNGRVDTVNTNIAAANTRIDATNTAINTVSGKATDIEKELYGGANGTGTINNPANGTVKKDLNTAQGNISTVQEDITTIQGDITTVQGDISDVQGDITTVQGDITDVQGDITDIQTDIGDPNTPNTIKGDISDVQGDITTVQGDITTVQGDIADVQSDIGDSNTPNTIKGDIADAQSNISDAQGDITDIQTDIGNVDVTNDGNLQTQIDNIVYYQITPKIYKSNLLGEVYSTTFRLGFDSLLRFYVEGFKRTGTPITSSTLSATLYTPSGQVTLTANKGTNNVYTFSHTPTETGVYMLQIGDSTCTCFASESYRIGNIESSLAWDNYYSDSNYDIWYNDYFVAIAVHISSTTASTSWDKYGVAVLSDDLRPHMPHLFFDQTGNVMLRVTDRMTSTVDDYKYLWRKSNTGSNWSGDLYAHTIWKRR